MLIKQKIQKIVSFATIVFLDRKVWPKSSFCNNCHDISMVSFGLNNIVVCSIKGVGYWCSEIKAIKMMKNSYLNKDLL